MPTDHRQSGRAPQGGTSAPVRNTDVRDGEQCVAACECAALFKDKWTILVLGSLAHHPVLRYNELRRDVEGISQRMLTLTLKSLEQRGLVTRTVVPSVPPGVAYALSPLGHSLGTPLKAMLEWSLEHRDEMAAARLAFARS